MDKSLHNVGELSAPDRSAVEGLVGHPLRDDQQLYIVALDVATPPSVERRAAWRELQAIIAEAHENVRQAGVTPDELEQAIDQACHDVRYGA